MNTTNTLIYGRFQSQTKCYEQRTLRLRVMVSHFWKFNIIHEQ
jgi:hypothetical protein